MERCDVVVVGARCAGSSLAVWLARQGLRVQVLDRARFPSETPSTHVIQPCGVRLLRQLGVLPAAMAAGAVPLERFTLVNDDVRVDERIDLGAFGAPGLCVRRITLDALLVDAAERAGAHVRTGCRVTGLIHDGHRVCGVRTTQGDIEAALVVGADGRHSTVAASVGAGEYHVTPPGRTPAWAYFDGVHDREGRIRLGRLGELAFLASPTDGGLYMAAVGPPITDRDAFRRDRDNAFTAGLANWPELADLLSGARRVGPIRLMSDWHGYFRHATGPGWVLVGDAGHFKDFTPAQGISDALRQAQRLAAAVAAGLDDGANLASELRRWWQWRDHDGYEMYWFATDLGAPGPSTPLITRLLRDIAADPDAT
ncbi:MAG: FAD-dependent monooxygenase, partial [Pseudonocardia sp.]|nr:FAD-dependent monooxygenase [Pseudonocardia sp.]